MSAIYLLIIPDAVVNLMSESVTGISYCSQFNHQSLAPGLFGSRIVSFCPIILVIISF